MIIHGVWMSSSPNMVGLQAMSVNELGTHQPRFPSKHAMMGQNLASIDRPSSTEVCLGMLTTDLETTHQFRVYVENI